MAKLEMDYLINNLIKEKIIKEMKEKFKKLFGCVAKTDVHGVDKQMYSGGVKKHISVLWSICGIIKLNELEKWSNIYNESDADKIMHIKIHSGNVLKQVMQYYGKYYEKLCNDAKNNTKYDEKYIKSVNLVLYNLIFGNCEGATVILDDFHEDDNKLLCLCFLWYLFYNQLDFDSHRQDNNNKFFEKICDEVKSYLEMYEENFITLKLPNDVYELVDSSDVLASKIISTSTSEGKRKLIQQAATTFLHLIAFSYATTIGDTDLPEVDISVFALQKGDTMENTNSKTANKQAVVNLWQIFNNNSCFQKVYAALLEDYMHLKDDTSAKSKLLENVSKGEIISYMLFIKNLLPLIDQQFEVIYQLFHYSITLMFNNPTVQKIIFEMEDMFADVNEFYIKYYHRVELECKFGSNVHTTKHEFLDAIPLIRYNFTDAKVINQFMKSDMHKGCIFKWHLYGETFGIFRLRLATKNDVPTIVDANKHKIDKKEFIATEPKEAEQAVLKNQLFIIEEAVGKRSKTEYFSDDELNIADENYQLAAFALMCPEIFTDVDYGKTINKEIGCRLEEHAVFNTGFVVDYNETEKASDEFKDNYRGYGFQRLFLGALTEMARVKGKKYAVCTVSPENKVSYGNIRAFGYEKIKEIEYDIDGVKYKRDFCQLYL